jgi:hypothetical protein
MTRNLGRKKRVTAVLLGSFALSLLMPLVASAGSNRHRGSRDRHHGNDHRYDYRSSHGHRGHDRGYRHGRYDRYSRYNRSHHAKSRYYCAACDHGFYSRSAFHSHLSGHHYVAPWLLPFAIIEHTLGWIFYG